MISGIVWTVSGWAPKEDLLGQHWLIPKHTQVSIVPVYWNNPVVCQTAVKLMLTIFLGPPAKNTNWADGSEKSDSCASNMKETKGKSKWKQERALIICKSYCMIIKLVPINEICQSWLNLWFIRRILCICLIEAEYELCHIITNDDLWGNFKVWILR